MGRSRNQVSRKSRKGSKRQGGRKRVGLLVASCDGPESCFLCSLLNGGSGRAELAAEATIHGLSVSSDKSADSRTAAPGRTAALRSTRLNAASEDQRAQRT